MLNIKRASTKRLEKRINQAYHDKKWNPQLKYMIRELKLRCGLIKD
jgi:hypothetical protein